MGTSISDNFFETISKYESCLGHGSFGIVLKAVAIHNNAASAVKFIFPHATQDTKEQQQIIRECNITSKLKAHENIIQVINVAKKHLTLAEIEAIFSQDIISTTFQRQLMDTYVHTVQRNKSIEAICIQMELCGETLRKWLNNIQEIAQAGMEIKQMRIILHLISGLTFLHQNKILHRDLKPENVMFSEGSYGFPVKIGDFGLCRNLHSEESLTSSLTCRVGTMEYMAPEVLNDEYDFDADLFSLGLIIWEIAQLIKFSKRMKFFDKLVNEREESLVINHPVIKNIKQVIIGLTKRSRTERMNLLEVDKFKKTWEKMIDPDNVDLDTELGEITVSNGDELKLALASVSTGQVIILEDGDFFGHFLLNVDNVIITGKGVETCIMCKKGKSFEITGNECTISNLKIIISKRNNGILLRGTHNTLENITFTGGDSCLRLFGNENKLKNLILSSTRSALSINGSNNSLDKIKLHNIRDTGITIDVDSNCNSISNITGVNMKLGINICGSNNNLSLINLNKMSHASGFWGVYISSGSHNTVDNLVCSGYERNKEDWALNIWSENSTLTNSRCGPVRIGRDNVELHNVDCGEYILILQNDNGVRLINCRGGLIKASAGVIIERSLFRARLY